MGRGTALSLGWTALSLLSVAPSANACLWCVNIDEGPAPPVADVPPFSRGAIRNHAVLPYQVIAVVAAYLGSVLILGTLLLTVGRSRRKQAFATVSMAQEMIKPVHKAFDPSPISPRSDRSWHHIPHMRSMRSMRSMTERSPGTESVVSFDTSVLEADRARMQTDMERLYAAVLEQDEQQGQPGATGSTDHSEPKPPEYASRYPLAHDPRLRHLQSSHMMNPPRSPVRAIYPPVGGFPDDAFWSSKADFPDSRPQTRGEPVSHLPSSPSPSRSLSPAPSSKKLRKSLRNLHISSPMQRPQDHADDEARLPLSPLSYIDPGIPPEPPTAQAIVSPEETPGLERMLPLYAQRDDEDDFGRRTSVDHLDGSDGSPRAKSPDVAERATPRLVTNFSKPAPQPIVVPAARSGTLPLREMNRQYAAQQQAAQRQQQTQAQTAAFPLSPRHWNSTRSPLSPSTGHYLTSAGPVKTTFVEARRDRLMPGGLRTGMATPYSPYMPFTPITPVTPHLTSRAERKQRAKEERATRGALTEEDAVVEEDEMWG